MYLGGLLGGEQRQPHPAQLPPKRHLPSAATTRSRLFTLVLDTIRCHVYYVAIAGLDNG